MALLESHLEQIEFCSATIAELPFPAPKIFTNAMLRAPDITALIRDTESHERALFSVSSQSEPLPSRAAQDALNRRGTAFGIGGEYTTANATVRLPRANTAVAAVLGGDMAERLRRERAGEGQPWQQRDGMKNDDLDVELLLQGAEKLCAAYPIPGALDRIAALRNRYKKVMSSVESYEELVSEQTEQLRQMNRSTSMGEDYEDEVMDDGQTIGSGPLLTEEDLKREEEGIKELERKKRTLEERVDGMEKDLGGLMR